MRSLKHRFCIISVNFKIDSRRNEIMTGNYFCLSQKQAKTQLSTTIFQTKFTLWHVKIDT